MATRYTLTVTPEPARPASVPAHLPSVHLVIGPNVWGKGFTSEQAHAAAGQPKEWIEYRCLDAWCVITGMGDIEYTPLPAARESFDAPPAFPMYWEVARRTRR